MSGPAGRGAASDQQLAAPVRMSTRGSWVRTIEQLVPDWKLSAGLRVIGDTTIDELARNLGAEVMTRQSSTSILTLPSGRRVVAERMAYLIDGRGSLELLRRNNLALPERT